jgi:ADP-heptose:LPS heptosyltransferase
MTSTPSDQPRRIWVFHAGALGDFVLIWPLLRALVRQGREVTVCTSTSKGALAAACLGVRPFNAERPEIARLWVPGTSIEKCNEHQVDAVISFLFDNASDTCSPQHVEHDDSNPLNALSAAAATTCTRPIWTTNTHAWLGAREIIHAGPPGSQSREILWERFSVAVNGRAQPCTTTGGPITCHVGAGSPRKRWPMRCWSDLATELRRSGHDTRFIAGEVEHEQFLPSDRALFRALGGVYLDTLSALEHQLKFAIAFIGADSGPTHLAAQLGLPTLALFGPTDPRIWQPIGPTVDILAPEQPTDLTWLMHERVLQRLTRLLSTSR